MAIDVVCPGCLARFKVSDNHAGKKGLCPKCKHEIQVPSLKDQVVVHAPDDISGPKDAKGRPVLKPIEWEEMKVPAIAWVIAGAVTVGVFAVAWMSRATTPEAAEKISYLFLGGATLLLGPLMAWAMWWIFRNEDLETFDDMTLIVRSLACGFGYAILWGIYAYMISDAVFSQGGSRELWLVTFLSPPMVVAGTFISAMTLKLDFNTAALHYLVFLTVCVLLRLTMGLPAF